jgi:hypothetical protein
MMNSKQQNDEANWSSISQIETTTSPNSSIDSDTYIQPLAWKGELERALQ